MSAQPYILIVEDDPDGQQVVSHILGFLNMQIDTANTAEQALYALFEHNIRYSAIIIDLSLPGKDGWSLLHDILRSPETADIPCIAVTAYHTSKLREEAIQAGFTAYFPKPIEATAFVRQLEHVLGGQA